MSTRLAERLPLIALMYGVSGALGLVYEVAFNKYLAFVFGATAYASSAVLVAFMGGLALGAHVASRVERRISRPLFAYGVAELAIGGFCWIAPHLLARVLPGLYVAAVARAPGSLVMISVLRATLAIAVVLVPAAGMGATLPLLARFVQREDPMRARRRLARLYALNTFGGALGSLLGAYVIIPELGLKWTMQGGALVSGTIGLVAVVLGFGHHIAPEASAEAAKKAEKAAESVTERGDIAAGSLPFDDAVVLAAASGLLVFGCEVVFVHVLAVVIGTSVYAFGLMLFIFLVCLSLGAPVATRLAGRYGASAAAVGFAASGIALVLSLVVWDRLPSLFIAVGPVVRTWPARELTRSVAAAVALAVPVVLMGTTFPLVLRTARTATVGADVGKLTVANTLGSIGGSIILGFLVLPALGSQRSLLAIGLVYLAVAAYVVRSSREATERVRVLRLVAVGVLAAIAVPRWDLARLTSGANVYFNDGTVPNAVVESINEDVHGGVTTVVRDPDGVRTLLTNGKFEGNDGREIGDNRGLVHLPVAFAKKRENGVVIGLGTGTSAGTMAAYDFASIDIVELSPAMVRAAKTTFAELNHHVMSDPRVRLLLDDGRNVLLLTDKKYDVVSIEVSSIWFAGSANLYNKEFYQLVERRLAEGGVLQQWFQLHHTNQRIVASEIASLRTVFPYVSVAVTGHQGQLLASKSPLTVSRAKLFDLENVGYVRETLQGGHLVDHVKKIVVDHENVNAFLDETAEQAGLSFSDLVSTDDNLFLEYATPKMNVPTSDDIPDTIAYLTSYKTRKSLTLYITP